MRLSAKIFALLNIVLASVVPVNAAPLNEEFSAAIGRQGYGRCHMDQCSFFVIDAVAPIGKTKKGTLLAVSYRGWGATYRPTDDGHQYDHKPINIDKPKAQLSIVFCSKIDPVYFNFYNNKWNETKLRPGDDSAIYGASESYYTSYFAACHNYITQTANIPSDLAKKLGYNFRGGFPDDENFDMNRSPTDMLK